MHRRGSGQFVRCIGFLQVVTGSSEHRFPTDAYRCQEIQLVIMTIKIHTMNHGGRELIRSWRCVSQDLKTTSCGAISSNSKRRLSMLQLTSSISPGMRLNAAGELHCMVWRCASPKVSHK